MGNRAGVSLLAAGEWRWFRVPGLELGEKGGVSHGSLFSQTPKIWAGLERFYPVDIVEDQ
jgi:hypothetical protein